MALSHSVSPSWPRYPAWHHAHLLSGGSCMTYWDLLPPPLSSSTQVDILIGLRVLSEIPSSLCRPPVLPCPRPNWCLLSGRRRLSNYLAWLLSLFFLWHHLTGGRRRRSFPIKSGVVWNVFLFFFFVFSPTFDSIIFLFLDYFWVGNRIDGVENDARQMATPRRPFRFARISSSWGMAGRIMTTRIVMMMTIMSPRHGGRS